MNEGGEDFSFWGSISEALASIPAAFSELGGTFTDPLGLSVGDVTSLEAASEDQELGQSTFGAMVQSFDGKVGAVAYLLFILIYYPCLAAVSAIYRETSLKWTLFAVIYLTLLAWAVATLFYQLGTFARHPEYSIMWIIILGAAFSAFLYGMKKGAGTIPGKRTSMEMLQHI